MENELPKGLFAKKPSPHAPSFIKGKVSIKVADFIDLLQAEKEEWLNFDLLETKDGSKYYFKRDTWKPEPQGEVKKADDSPIEYPADDLDPDDIPFS